MYQKILILCLLAWNIPSGTASGLLLTQVEVENTAPFSVKFNIAWDHSWKNERNHDAAWVFLKFQPRQTEYNARHVLLQPVEPLYLASVKKEIPMPTVQYSEDRVGVFIYPSKLYSGPIEWTIRLTFDPTSIGDFDIWEGTWQLYALEMVYIPAGAFVLGDPDTSALNTGAFYQSAENGQYQGLYHVNQENQLITIGKAAGNLCYRNPEPMYQGDAQGDLPAAFPKGVKAFYIMKYEITQGEYAAFLNTLSTDVSNTRANFAGKGYYKSRGCIVLEGEKYIAQSSKRPLNFVGWDDGCAFADWSGLRPMSELEFEKACRGDRTPIKHEYPWGTSDKNQLARFVDTDDELKWGTGVQENILSNQTQSVFGASHYWVMDLAGSLWEKVVSVGQPNGRKFEGTHGDGRLQGYGFASNKDWPKGDYDHFAGFGYRGGGYYEHGKSAGDFNPHSPLGWRNFAAWSCGPRSIAYGFRCVRTAPVLP